MANTSTKADANKSGTKTTPKANEPEVATEEVKSEAPIVAKDIDPEMYVIVRNGFQGKLVYKSPRTGERFVWNEFGSEQEMQLRELRNAKNAHKKFFINNWFMFDESWIIDYLGVRQYYRNTFSIDHYDDIFKLSITELKKAIKGMSDGQKKSLTYRATQLIASGEIDSRKKIAALEESLSRELIEK